MSGIRGMLRSPQEVVVVQSAVPASVSGPARRRVDVWVQVLRGRVGTHVRASFIPKSTALSYIYAQISRDLLGSEI